MLDIRLLREKPEECKARLALRNASLAGAVDDILEVDSSRRAAETCLQQIQAERNRLSKEIGKMRSQGVDSSEAEATVKNQGLEMEGLAESASALAEQQREKLLSLPNLPHEAVPHGQDASANPVIRAWGEQPAGTPPPDHLAIAENLGLVDFARGAKVAGSAFACYTGQGARLGRALINFLLDLHTTESGYTEIAPPLLVRPEALVGTSQLPKFEEQLYRCERDDLYLAPTAEVPVTNLHREEVVASLPIRYAAYTPCFRREAGAAGLGTRGLIRMHQFDKVELVKICRPQDSPAELESLTADAEKVLQRLGLHYRVIELCAGDLGFGASRTYDIEVWAPGQAAYLEVSSCTDFGDYQARRMNLRFKGPDGKPQFCHTINGSGTALARLYVAILETGYQPDGSVRLPAALKPYFGEKDLTAPCRAA